MAPPRVADPADVVLSTKIPKHVAHRLRESARANDRSMSGEIRRVLKEWARADGGDNAAAR